MRRLRLGVILGALLIVAGCSSSPAADAGVGDDAGSDAGRDAGRDAGTPDAGDGGALTCADFGFVASGDSCGSGCGSVTCACPSGFPRSVGACTQDGCIVAMDCEAVCAAPSLGDAIACTDTHTVEVDAGTDAGVDGGSDAGSDAGVDAGVPLGCFGTPTPFGDAGSGNLLAVDVDGDGRLDLVTDEISGGVHVWRNEGDGGFGLTDALDAGGHSSGRPRVADVTGDGRPDVVLSTGSGFRVLANDGGLGFVVAADVDAGYWADRVELADVNHDGRLDVVTRSVNSGSMLDVHGNQGDGGWSLAASLTEATNDEISALRAADLNEDGWPDLVLGEYDQGTPDLRVLLNQQDGGFADAGGPTLSFGQFISGVVLADFSQDGHQDIASSGSIWTGDGTGALTQAQPGDFQDNAVAVDLDGDGRVDLAWPGSARVEVALNEPDGGFLYRYVATGLHTNFVFGDFDGDGRVDLATLDYDQDVIRVYPNSCGPGTPPACSPEGAPCASNGICCSASCGGGACL